MAFSAGAAVGTVLLERALVRRAPLRLLAASSGALRAGVRRVARRGRVPALRRVVLLRGVGHGAAVGAGQRRGRRVAARTAGVARSIAPAAPRAPRVTNTRTGALVGGDRMSGGLPGVVRTCGTLRASATACAEPPTRRCPPCCWSARRGAPRPARTPCHPRRSGGASGGKPLDTPRTFPRHFAHGLRASRRRQGPPTDAA